MAKKILLNILLNIAIITIVLSLFWLFNNRQYALGIAGIFALGLFIYFKIRLIKNVRRSLRDTANRKRSK